MKPWGRFATFALAAVALLVGQLAALIALTYWYGRGIGHLPNFSGDGAAIAIIIASIDAGRGGAAVSVRPARGHQRGRVSRPDLAAPQRSDLRRRGHGRPDDHRRRAELAARAQRSSRRSRSTSIRPPSAGGWLVWLWLAIVVVTPIGEEIIFRGFLFRGWLRSPRDVWPVIIATAFLWAIIHCNMIGT